MAKAVDNKYNREDLPDFGGVKVFVLPGAFYGSVVSMLAQCGMQKATTIEESEIVVFVGGEDIDPRLYDEPALKCTWFSTERDTVEEWAYHKAKKLNKMMFGICRGAQFLHAMNGGKLWQDVKNHGSSHMIVDIEDNVELPTSSMHHQMLQYNENMDLIAVAAEQISHRFEDAKQVLELKLGDTELEIEAGAYKETKCFFTQGHPEVGPNKYRSWCMWKLNDFYWDWTAINGKSEDNEMEKAIIEQIG